MSDQVDKLDAAMALVLDHLTDANAHTLAALLEWQHTGDGDHERMNRAYKAAQLIISGTQ